MPLLRWFDGKFRVCLYFSVLSHYVPVADWLRITETRAPCSASSAVERWLSRLACEEIGCVSQTFELSDDDFSAIYEFFCQLSTNPNKDE